MLQEQYNIPSILQYLGNNYQPRLSNPLREVRESLDLSIAVIQVKEHVLFFCIE